MDNFWHICRPQGVSWPWPKVISPRSRSHCTHTKTSCPSYNSSLPCWIWIILHWIVVHQPSVSWPWPKVIYPRSRSQCTHTKNMYSGYNSSLLTCVGYWYFTQLLSWPKGVIWGHISKVKVTLHTNNLCPGHNSSLQFGSRLYFTQWLSMTQEFVMTSI